MQVHAILLSKFIVATSTFLTFYSVWHGNMYQKMFWVCLSIYMYEIHIHVRFYFSRSIMKFFEWLLFTFHHKYCNLYHYDKNIWNVFGVEIKISIYRKLNK